MYRKPIVVAFDGAPSSWTAAEWAASQAAGAGCPLRLVHVLRWPLPELDDLGPPGADLDITRVRQAATDTVAAATDRCRLLAPGVDVQGEVLTGNTVGLLVEVAMGAQLLVLGSSGQTACPQVLLGSSAAELARSVLTPVAVIRDVPAVSRGGRSVVIGIDGSAACARVLHDGFAVAARHGHPVVAVHAWSDLPLEVLGMDPLVAGERANADGSAVLAAELAAQRRAHPEVSVHEVVTVDRPVVALLEQAVGAALIVVGRHGRARSGDAPLGSVSHAVLHYAPCPVLLAG
ncbi:universal stress protein [Pseudonocardia sp. GCM10023141]|uniref:universal stress protein n=1 Tax=Pseudonocardia sp. GCM10023141 TaxID=3252653 RepID=UPI0036165537